MAWLDKQFAICWFSHDKSHTAHKGSSADLNIVWCELDTYNSGRFELLLEYLWWRPRVVLCVILLFARVEDILFFVEDGIFLLITLLPHPEKKDAFECRLCLNFQHQKERRAQSRQSARLFLQTSELGPPHTPSSRWVCTPPPLVPGGGTLACGRGGGGGPNSDEGTDDVVPGTLGIYGEHWTGNAC